MVALSLFVCCHAVEVGKCPAPEWNVMSHITETERDAAIGALIAERKAARALARWTADPADGFERADTVYDVSRRSLERLAEDGVVDAVAYGDTVDDSGLRWHCPACWTAGPETGGEDVHNGYAHRATLSLTVSDGTGYWPYAVVVTITPADTWDADMSYLAVAGAQRYPGLTFTMACQCEGQCEMGCGQTFEVSAYSGATYTD